MFLCRLSSLGSSFPPRSLPSLSPASVRSITAFSIATFLPRFIPAPHPWWSVRGFPPWPPRFHLSHPSALDSFTHRTLRPFNVHSGSGWRSFCTSASRWMERPDRDKEPPYKRVKSAEEKKSAKEREGQRGGAPGATGGKDRGSKREHHHLDCRKDSSVRPNHHFNEGSRDRVRNDAGKGVKRENSRDKHEERTKSWSKDRQRKESVGRDTSASRGRSDHQQGGNRESQPAMHKPNPWFKERGAQDLGGLHRDAKGPSEQQRDVRGDGGQWTEFRPQLRSTAHLQNPWQAPEGNRRPPAAGISPPVKSLQRHWESCSTDLQPPGDSSVFDFSVMTYNILSQQLLQDNAYLYQHCDPGVLPWEYRLPNLLAEIKQHNADILCLQEVQEDHYKDQIKPALQELGYHCEYKKRTGRKPDGCAVIFKTSRFSLLSSNPVEFFRPGDALLNRDNVGLVLLLRPSSAIDRSNPSSCICVANTHLLYNPRRGDVKLAQMAILLAEITQLSRLPNGAACPVVLCGDFNSAPWSPLYRFLTTGCLEYEGMQMGMVSGQENSPRGQRLLPSPIWSPSLGINHQCQYESKPPAENPPISPTAVEGAISNLSVEDLAARAAAAFSRAKIEHGLKLQSSYRHHLTPDRRPEITTCHSRTAMTVDYILYSPDFVMPPSLPAGVGLQLLGRLSLVGQPELEEVNGLPNQHHSSDHLPLLARFRFRC